MRFTLTSVFAMMLASPAFAASGPFFSLRNTDFVVLIAFLIFIGILIYVKVPSMMAKMLDARAEGIKSEIEEARKLREDAQTLLASYERKQKEVQEQANRIVEAAKEEAAAASAQARADLATSVERRLAAAEEQIGSAEAAAVKEVRDQAVLIAVAASRDIIGKQMTAAEGNKLIDAGIAQVDAKLH
ncbi:F0F1 ATP synthase subunit B [Sulfitobacter donghicola]|uniref:ATP synthase subunit b n=1 Tax=Sulfitobacter donghicola DSW-25 = KCTC 12864 = JCM 14565 TaxID=1300350 RepID=A0A073IMK8_9RHOB|nr:F0F1 ATP synthase subunit B [Sulfitobacter donghicola]KEJ90974.1 F0F1 ATP synthase subunit B [Sulfitobacter donghicola DSW-25 = KCTC 12864 = JCM 14565]KIN68268.1 ATP synthase subunit b [Sulfitobacter donghicola DSW-25 = KCTC 12864 = JCM 14565]